MKIGSDVESQVPIAHTLGPRDTVAASRRLSSNSCTTAVAQVAKIVLYAETQPGKINVAFTRGYVSSQAFVDKFLLNKATANTNIAKSSYNTDLTKWVTWSTPALQ